jgi:pSer/pThr/pTyr-binding forkhead associated (FHA) protein
MDFLHKRFALICTAFPPIYLERNVQYTIGREQNNSIVLINDLISRNHSAIIIDLQGNAFLEDKGSRNGTMLNGIRIQKRTPLKSDDKITIGSYHIFYKEISTSPTENFIQPVETTTLALGELGGPDGMVGNLGQMKPTELFTTLSYNEKTGVLTISDHESEGSVYFRLGNPIQAHYKHWKHLDAIFNLLSLKEGIFDFIPKDISKFSSEIPLTTQQILLEYARKISQ